jgi:hypothetical protein
MLGALTELAPPTGRPLMADMQVIVRLQDRGALRLDHLHDQALCEPEGRGDLLITHIMPKRGRYELVYLCAGLYAINGGSDRHIQHCHSYRARLSESGASRRRPPVKGGPIGIARSETAQVTAAVVRDCEVVGAGQAVTG